MERKNNTYRVSLIVLLVTYAVGILGFQLDYFRELFLFLTPFHLLLTAFLLIVNSPDKGIKIWVYFTISGILGYLVEVLGVKTGLIFGNYAYGPTLGLKLFDVPLMIGVNWFLLTYSIGMVTQKIVGGHWFSIIFGSVVLVSLDYFIEPVAIRFAFWSWDAGDVPLHNYIGWFGTSLVLMAIFRQFKFSTINPLAIYILVAQILFFALLGVDN
ncbi:MAG: carotenoid biosynthesis protein [Cytophagales bacterium]|nr:carotenoid biosynthesis protein [Cytophagales bacterium]